MKKIILTLFVLAIVVLGYELRLSNGTSVPLPGQSLDEYSNAWVGMSLIRLGLPIGISGLSTYQNLDKRYINVDHIFQGQAEGQPLAINYPWFDHPPMMGVFTGTWAYLKGARVFEDASVAIIRKPIIIIGSISVLLVYLLAAEEFGSIAGLAASMIYAVSPLVVVGSRMGQAENGFIPLFLFSIFCLRKYLTSDKKYWLWIGAIVGGFGLTFKLSAIAITLAGMLILMLSGKKFRDIVNDLVIFLVPAVSFLMLFVAFGISIDSKTFWMVFLSNADRRYGIGFNSIFELITQSKITGTKFLTDPWVLFGWLSFIFLLAKKEGVAVKAAILGYLAVYLYFGSESYGWYRFPFLPFLAISSGWLCSKLVNKEMSLPLGVSLLMAIGILLTKLTSIENSFLVSVWKYGSVAVVVFLTWYHLSKVTDKKIQITAKAILLVLLVAAVVMTLMYNHLFNVDYWYKVN